MKPLSWPSICRRFVALALLAVVLAAGPSGCSLTSLSSHPSTTSGVVSTLGETRSTTTTTLRPSTTSTSSTTSSTLRRPTTTSSVVAHATTGDPKAISKKVKPSVVGITAITATTATMIYEQIGTGVIYSATSTYAYIVTANHVIQRDDGTAAKRIKVTLSTGATVSASLVGRDPAQDMAVLKVKARRLTPAVFRTDLSDLAINDFVVAIGNAKVIKQPVVSGRVLGFLHDVRFPQLPAIQVSLAISSSAPLQEGDSGGPLLDVDGKVVGIDLGRPETGSGGISLPADVVVQEVKQIIAAAN